MHMYTRYMSTYICLDIDIVFDELLLDLHIVGRKGDWLTYVCTSIQLQLY